VKKRTVAALFILVATCFATGQTQASKANYTVYQVRGDVKAPRPISTPMPAPPDSVDKQLKVRVSFVVAPDGSVADVKLLKRSTPDFDDYAVSVVSKWKFEPATKDGNPVAVRLETDMRSHK
jgi:TonB family protein